MEGIMKFGTYLVLSTAHVRCATAELLTGWAALAATEQPVAVSATLCGWFLPTSGDHRQLPDELGAVLALGRSLGCGYVLLDSDGEEIPDLPVFPW
jgi:hypothetical protein